MPKISKPDSTSENNPKQARSMLELALWYASEGVAVFPLRSERKDPVLPGGFKSATRDETQIRDWWTEYPQANIGGHPGANRVVLDVDGPDHNERDDAPNGFESVEGYDLPETFKCYTGSGGEHHWFRLPGSEEEWSTYKTTQTRALPGVDLRGAKGYVVLPGSIHPNGQPYLLDVDGEKVDPRTLDKLPSLHGLSVAPGWLLDLCRGTSTGQPTKERGKAKETLQELLNNPPEEGGRNDWLTRVAGHYAHRYAQDRDKFERCVADAGNKTTPPMDSDEVARVAESIWTTEQDRRQFEFERLEKEGRLAPPPEDPTAVARWLMDKRWKKDELPTLIRWEREFYRWRGDWWEVYNSEDLSTVVRLELEHVVYVGPKGDPTPWRPKTHKIKEVVDALVAVSRMDFQLDNGRTWIAEPTCDAAAIDLLPVKNGLLNLRTRELVPATPALFATWGTPYEYDPEAKAEHWTEFIGKVYEPTTRKALQEWFGYLLSSETRMQKMFWLWGAPGSGKGTTHRILERLLGSDSANTTAGAEIGDLRSDFGGEHWIGKSLVTFTDSASGMYAGGQGLSRLKSYTGGDRVSINRKNIGYWEGVPSFRLMFLSNEPPTWSGDAKPMVRRLVVGRTTGERIEGDQDLETLFVAEMPGVLNWALEGLVRLRETGEFSEPETQHEDLEAMVHTGLTINEFFLDCFTETKDADETNCNSYPFKEVYGRFRDWWEDEGGHTKPPNSAMFETQIRAMNDDRISVIRPGKRGEKRVREVVVRCMQLIPRENMWDIHH